MRYFIGFLITIGLIILLIILLFHGGGSKGKVPTTTKTLDSYSTTDATVSLTIDGPIIAAQNHNTARITISQTEAKFELIQGYDNQVVNSTSYPNTESGYDVFLHALKHAGFTLGSNTSTLQDERGYCPTGDRYIFELKQDGKTLERYWATSCGSPKTFRGNLALNMSLFKSQIPNYSDLTLNTRL